VSDTGSRRDRWLGAILLAALAVRLIGIGAPILGVHSWRQADTAAVARNFYENGSRLLYPQIDFGGAGPGYVAMEFPLYSFLVAAVYGVTGVHESAGRLLSSMSWLLLVVAVYDLARWAADRITARWTVAFAAFLPLNVFYGRAFMPEAMLLAGMAVGLACFRRWLSGGRPGWLLASWLAIAVACLLKIPCLYIGLPLAWLAWYHDGWSFLRRPAIWLYAVLLLAVVAGWYGHSHRVGLETGLSFGIFNYGSDKWGRWELLADWQYWNSILFRSLAERHLTWGAVPLLLIGFLRPAGNRRSAFFVAWLAAILVYFLIVQGGNLTHEYYQLPAVLPLSFFLGRGTAWLLAGDRPNRRLARGMAVTLLSATAVLSVLRLGDYLGREDPRREADAELARLVASHTDPHDLGVFLTGGDPTVLYLSHRKGWIAAPATFDRPWLNGRVAKGARFLAAREDLFPSELDAGSAGDLVRRNRSLLLLLSAAGSGPTGENRNSDTD
jgi:4-amino-4-deoxy-L-arabinose transferase-like glycosyltransferase